MKKNLLNTVVIALLLAFSLSSCGVEYQYYRQNKRHSPEYNERNHRSNEGERHGDKDERH